MNDCTDEWDGINTRRLASSQSATCLGCRRLLGNSGCSCCRAGVGPCMIARGDSAAKSSAGPGAGGCKPATNDELFCTALAGRQGFPGGCLPCAVGCEKRSEACRRARQAATVVPLRFSLPITHFQLCAVVARPPTATLASHQRGIHSVSITRFSHRASCTGPAIRSLGWLDLKSLKTSDCRDS